MCVPNVDRSSPNATKKEGLPSSSSQCLAPCHRMTLRKSGIGSSRKWRHAARIARIDPAARDVSGNACKVLVNISRICSTEDVTWDTTSRWCGTNRTRRSSRAVRRPLTISRSSAGGVHCTPKNGSENPVSRCTKDFAAMRPFLVISRDLLTSPSLSPCPNKRR